jgi:ABC-2 type transport system permease protein
MRMSGILDKMLAIARRDLLTAVRYRSGFVITAGGTLVELAAFYYLSRAIGPGFRPEGIAYFPFLLVGTGMYTFLVMGINSFFHVVQEAQNNGTLEILMTTCTPGAVLVFLSALSAFASTTLQLILYLGMGLLLFGAPLHANLASAVVVFGLSVIIAFALGMFAAAVQLSIQKGSALVWLMGSGAWFLTGTLFPVGTLPLPLRAIAGLIPITHSLNAMRMAILQDAGLGTLGREIEILALFCAVLMPLSIAAFSYTLRRARLEGTLSFY